MRLHFISRLALLTIGSFLVVATQVSTWSTGNLDWMFYAGGGLAILIAAGDTLMDNIQQRALDFVTALVGAWMIVETLTLSVSDLQWWRFGSAVALAVISMVGLAIHEWGTERVVHELNVTHKEETPREYSASSLS